MSSFQLLVLTAVKLATIHTISSIIEKMGIFFFV